MATTSPGAAVAAHTVLRNYEVPTLRVGELLPTDDDYRMMPGDHPCRAHEGNHGGCDLTDGHPGNVHVVASLSGVIICVWEQDPPARPQWWGPF